MLEHGGRLRQAAQAFQIPLPMWLDLSTGLAPYIWPLPALAADIWMRLPECDDGLEQAARAYYGAPFVLPVAGSQAAIQALPAICGARRVGIVEPCYAEHRLAWQRAGCEVIALDESEVAAYLPRLDVLVLVNPNNPTGRLLDADKVLGWHDQLHQRGACLIVDEAFADLEPANSLASFSDREGLIVLRSLGKFFGLGGVRLGFVLAEPELLHLLERQLGPWSVSGPTRAVGKAVLTDRDTQTLWRRRLQYDGRRLESLLTRYGLAPAGGCDLFQWVPHSAASTLYKALARRGILVRLLGSPAALRFGLPGSEQAWSRLEQALVEIQPLEGQRIEDQSNSVCAAGREA